MQPTTLATPFESSTSNANFQRDRFGETHRKSLHLRCASEAAAVPGFRILWIKPDRFGDKVANCCIHVAGIGQFEAELFTPSNRPPFVRGRPLRRWDWADEPIIRFEAAFSDAICLAIAAQLGELEAAP